MGKSDYLGGERKKFFWKWKDRFQVSSDDNGVSDKLGMDSSL
jgi:hypothetical protein